MLVCRGLAPGLCWAVLLSPLLIHFRHHASSGGRRTCQPPQLEPWTVQHFRPPVQHFMPDLLQCLRKAFRNSQTIGFQCLLLSHVFRLCPKAQR